MIHIDLGIPARKGIVDKIVGEEITFKKSFSMRGKARALPKVEKAADDLIKGFQEEKDKYIDSVKLDLLCKSSDLCECLGDLHRLLSGIASLVNEAKGGPVRKILGSNHSIVKGMSTHYEKTEGKPEIEVTVTYKNVDVGDLIQRAEPFTGVMGV